MIVALVVTSFVVGLIVTFVLPQVLAWVTGAAGSNATATSILSNKWVMVFVTGLIVAVGILLFTWIASKVPVLKKEVLPL